MMPSSSSSSSSLSMTTRLVSLHGRILSLLLVLFMLMDYTNGFLIRTTHQQPSTFTSRGNHHGAQVFVQDSSTFSTSSSSTSSSSSSPSTTRLGLFFHHSDTKELVKLAAPLTTSSVAAAFPAAALLAPLLSFIDDGNLVGSSAILSKAAAVLGTSTAAGAAAATTGTAAASSASATSMIEAEILSDISHVVLDLFTVFGSPSLVAVRLASVVGRILIMAADYIPDHFVLPEELIFQVFMLSVAWVGLVKSTLPLALSNLAFSSSFKHKNNKSGGGGVALRDGKAYVELFRPVGVTWKQFKALSVYALDWVDIQEGSVITTNEKQQQQPQDDDDYVYWLYRGQAVVHSMGTTVHDIVRCSSTKSSLSASEQQEETCVSAAMALLGELNWTTQQQQRQKNKALTTTVGSSSNGDNNSNNNYPGTTVTAGRGGATLLRIHKTPLSKLMEDDVELGHAIRDLMFQGIQDKLAAQWLQKAASSSSSSSSSSSASSADATREEVKSF